MPQARRKTPFSGKAKKQQLKAKKNNTLLVSSTSATGSASVQEVVSLNFQPSQRGGRGDRNRYALKFYRETDEELQAAKEEAGTAVQRVSEKDMEINPSLYFPSALSFPQRPPWSFEMSPAQLEMQEQRYFTEYVSKLEKSEYWKSISYFELNLETWRQLWRVLEMCDILLLISDVRYAGCMFPPSLYEYIKSHNKNMILVLNKIDLVPASVVAGWKEYFTKNYPGLRVVYFTSCPGYNLRAGTSDKNGLQIRRRKGRLRMCTEGATKLLEACQDIVEEKVDLTSWERKIKEEMELEVDDDEGAEVGETILQAADTSYYQHAPFAGGQLSVGCVGAPNVGKSSLMNALMGRRVVSVSRTPGHTKHFQTIYLTPQVRLCDCPGLVFPSAVPRPLQILMGSYPIAQLRSPFACIRYIAERVDTIKLLGLKAEPDASPRELCEAWAEKRGFLTAKAARLDAHRAANSILRMALDGKISFWLRPPGFMQDRETFETCEEIKYIKWVQALTGAVAEMAATESDDDTDRQTDGQTDSSSEEETTVVVNKFAALASDDDNI